MFLKKNRSYLIGALLATAAYAAGHMFFIEPLRAETEQEVVSCRKLLDEIEKYYRRANGTVPLSEGHSRLDAETKAQKEVRNKVMQIHFNMPAEFAVPRDWEPNVYFDRMLKEVVGRAGAAVQFAGKDAGTIGFTQRFLEKKEDVNLRFRRLAVAARFLEAMKAAGVERLVSIHHAKSASYGPPDVNIHIEPVSMFATVQAPEKSFVALVHELQRPGKYLAVRGIRISVTDPTSGMLDATLFVSGLFVTPGPYVPPKSEGSPLPVPLERY